MLSSRPNAFGRCSLRTWKVMVLPSPSRRSGHMVMVSLYAPAMPCGADRKLRRPRPSTTEDLHVPTFSADVLISFAKSLFVASAVPGDEADRVARSLVDANLCGHD